MSVQFERVALIGIGLIGSSLAHIMRREKIAESCRAAWFG
jgi:prephenate dehydrogenase